MKRDADRKGDSALTEKELKKLNRYQLLELLVMQTERADELQKKVDELEKRLEERELKFSKLGSISEAAMQIFEVFEASQKAADFYLESAKKQADDILGEARLQAESMSMQSEVKEDCILNAPEEDHNIETEKQIIDDKES